MGSISGGCFNPALATGLSMGGSIFEHGDGNWGSVWIYWLAPSLAGLVAGLFFRLSNAREFDELEENDGEDMEDLIS